MSLLPSSPDTEAGEDAEPRVVGVDSDAADEVIAALSSGTARELLAALHDEPAPPSKLADEVDTSLQNAQYHLENLEDAGAVEVVDTAYSAKGREMDVYAPADRPLVVFAGSEDDESTLKAALSRLLGAVGLLAVASLAVQQLFGRGGLLGGGPPAAGTGGDPAASGAGTQTPETTTPEPSPTPESDVGVFGGNETLAPETPAAEPAETPTPDPETTTATVDAAREVAAGLPPGLVFFAGGLFALAIVAGVVYVSRTSKH